MISEEDEYAVKYITETNFVVPHYIDRILHKLSIRNKVIEYVPYTRTLISDVSSPIVSCNHMLHNTNNNNNIITL